MQFVIWNLTRMAYVGYPIGKTRTYTTNPRLARVYTSHHTVVANLIDDERAIPLSEVVDNLSAS